MSYPRPGFPNVARSVTRDYPQQRPAVGWTVRQPRPAAMPPLAYRRYDILWRDLRGDICDRTVRAPIHPIFEGAFNAFARGALIQTLNGPVAVEDLLPGDFIETTTGEALPINWIGSMSANPRAGEAARLYRVTADTFGLGRPAPDLLLGAGARHLMHNPALSVYLGRNEALAPVSALVDGDSVVEVTPVSAVRTYHIALPQHRLIRVNGLEMETYHPGATAAGQLVGELRERFLDLFPHLGELGDFGAMFCPRLSERDLDALHAA